jgi:hypothetical protein
MCGISLSVSSLKDVNSSTWKPMATMTIQYEIPGQGQQQTWTMDMQWKVIRNKLSRWLCIKPGKWCSPDGKFTLEVVTVDVFNWDKKPPVPLGCNLNSIMNFRIKQNPVSKSQISLAKSKK